MPVPLSWHSDHTVAPARTHGVLRGRRACRWIFLGRSGERASRWVHATGPRSQLSSCHSPSSSAAQTWLLSLERLYWADLGVSNLGTGVYSYCETSAIRCNALMDRRLNLVGTTMQKLGGDLDGSQPGSGLKTLDSRTLLSSFVSIRNLQCREASGIMDKYVARGRKNRSPALEMPPAWNHASFSPTPSLSANAILYMAYPTISLLTRGDQLSTLSPPTEALREASSLHPHPFGGRIGRVGDASLGRGR